MKIIRKKSLEGQLEAVKEDGRAIQDIHVQKLYVQFCLKNNVDIKEQHIPDLDLELIQNQIDCVDLIK